MSEIEIQEKRLMDNMLKNATMLLEEAIKNIMGKDEKNKNEDMLKGILHIQISTELFFKYYIGCVYGFEDILEKKAKDIRDNNPEKYLEKLINSQIRTLSYQEIFKFFEENNDGFFEMKYYGKTWFYGLEIEEFEETFDKFNKIRNSIVHSGYRFEEEELKWIKSDFVIFVILIVYRILKHVRPNSFFEGEYQKFENYEEFKELTETPIDIFKLFLSKQVIKIMQNDEDFIMEMEDIADSISEYTAECRVCKTQALVLDIQDGWSKCFCCGDLYFAGYADCCICKKIHTVQYDASNIEYNHNILPGYCNSCKKSMAVYKCPECDSAYTYEYLDKINFNWECCENNFNEQYYGGSLDCPICKGNDTVQFYGEFNDFQAYCDKCTEKMSVYVCPDCGNKYAYDGDFLPELLRKCCKQNFKPYWEI